MFGYLQIGEIYKNDDIQKAFKNGVYSDHPHVINTYDNENILFVAKDKFENTDIPGWGTFKYCKSLELTKPGYRKSVWELPKYFHYNANTEISYHKNIDRFKANNFGVLNKITNELG